MTFLVHLSNDHTQFGPELIQTLHIIYFDASDISCDLEKVDQGQLVIKQTDTHDYTDSPFTRVQNSYSGQQSIHTNKKWVFSSLT